MILFVIGSQLIKITTKHMADTSLLSERYSESYAKVDKVLEVYMFVGEQF